MDNFKRTYRMMAGVPGEEGFLIGDEVNGRALHISFDLEKSDSQSSNTGKITVSNLNQQHREILKKKGCVVELMAGYADSVSSIFLGDVSEINESINANDNDTEIELIDGLTTYDVVGSLSFSGQIDGLTVLQSAVEQMGVRSSVISPGAEELLTNAVYSHGYCKVGKTKSAVQEICAKAGCSFTLQNGIMQVFSANEEASELAYVISPETGLISIPKKMSTTKSSKSSSTGLSSVKSSESTTEAATGSSDTQTVENGHPGYEVEYFINGAIGINDVVCLQSKYASGFFRVKKQKYTGDNYQGDWKCTAQLEEV